MYLHSPVWKLPSSICCCLLVSLAAFWQKSTSSQPLSAAYAMITRIGKRRKVRTASQISTTSFEMKTRTMSNQM